MVIITVYLKDVKDNYYILEGSDEAVYQIPVGGSVQVEHNALIAISENKYLKVVFEDNNKNVQNDEVQDPQDEMSNEHAKAEWSQNATKMLLELYKTKKEMLDNRNIKTLKRMWELISKDLNDVDSSYIYTPQQCESKWKSLERAYKKVVDNNNKTGRNKRSCPFENELAAILAKRVSITPPRTLDSTTENIQLDEPSTACDMLEGSNSRSSTPDRSGTPMGRRGEKI